MAAASSTGQMDRSNRGSDLEDGYMAARVWRMVRAILVVVGVVVLPFLVTEMYHNIVLSVFAQQLYKCSLPEHTEIIEKHKVCGKLYGNGDGMDFWACILVKSDKTLDELEAYFNAVPFRTAKPHHETVERQVVSVNEKQLKSDFLEHRTIIFDRLPEGDTSGYYAVIIYDSGYWNFLDIRGT